ncbi:endoplasmic reticulum mannosyl-oligosaccharide 1,2-alpha-mannosidase-like [Histomonas meleagridis]|uniref:endoplasmic reticulum mannosyl-oligosaccharide 1,2-alpha-mannosidase-like n=1 Tax=Histomonas meleagridis TaxID=135588 RepID=UPI003559B046|nr:endoplasmic reticulum mannosyl-oligosaccharide 1,2-alpha-mannosidase-like [Histomonas meleagridis]KAH0802611.1 endoplasmic reticulum mannosyl-oligosaccharide 1,2-alpha-mannosidase-like [Histomonas meleagridis]
MRALIPFLIEILIISCISFFLLSKAPAPMLPSPKVDALSFYLGNVDAIKTNSYIYNLALTSIQSYVNNCLGSDYYQPITKQCLNQSYMSLTAIDSLDTALIIGASKEYEQLRDYVTESFSCANINHFISTHDLITHVIGGLISAYSLSSDRVFLEKAVECAQISLSAFNSQIPNPLIHGKAGSSKPYPWISGTTLSDSSGFPLEFTALTKLTKISKYSKHVNNYFSCINKLIHDYNNLPVLFLSTSTCSVTRNLSGLTSNSVGFFSNLLRTHLYNPQKETSEIIKWFENKFDQTNLKTILSVADTTHTRFHSSLCQLIPLLNSLDKEEFPNVNKIASKLTEKCQQLMNDKLPSVSGKFGRNYISVDDDEFDFDSSFIENVLLTKKNLKDLKFLEKMNFDCNGTVCGLYTQDPTKVKKNMLSLEGLNKWLKYLSLENATFSYSLYVFNEAGHLIPKVPPE